MGYLVKFLRGGLAGALLLVSAVTFATPWQLAEIAEPPSELANPMLRAVRDFTTYRADVSQLRAEFLAAPREIFGIGEQSGIEVTLPTPEGKVERFRAWQTELLGPEVARQGPRQIFFMGQGIDDPTAKFRADLSVNGFQAFVLKHSGSYYVSPMDRTPSDRYVSFRIADRIFVGAGCLVKADSIYNQPWLPTPPAPLSRTTGATLYTFRLAINATQEYRGTFATQAAAEAAVATTVNNVNAIYERDLTSRVILVYRRVWNTTDPFTGNDAGLMIDENGPALNNTAVNPTAPGAAAYDVGHVFSSDGAGLAYRASLGTVNKHGGVTGITPTTGPVFDIDYFAHELGHQFGGRHTFNGTTAACGGNRSAVAAWEPGSGSTIMAYAGLCGAEDVQPNSDAMFHIGSIAAEILPVRNLPGSNGVQTATGNTVPSVDAGPNVVIPQSTAFRLTPASFSDNTPASLTFSWEQFDLGAATPPTTDASGPLVRTRLPSTNPTRFVPPQALMLANNYTNQFERPSSVNRNMTFRCVVRDNAAGGGGLNFDTMVISVSGAAFTVNAPATAANWNANRTQTVTWTVGGSGGTPNVRILLSTDGGNSYFNGTATTLLASTPNDGTQTVQLPLVATGSARIFVEGVNNIWFDANPGNFTISSTNTAPTWSTIPAQTIDEEAPWAFNVAGFASDIDDLQTRTFSLISGPAGLNVSTAGLISWTPTEAQGAGTYPVTVRVTDSGTPALSTNTTFNVTVNEVTKMISGTVTLAGVPSYPLGGTGARILFYNANNLFVAEFPVTLTATGGWTITTTSATFPAGAYQVFVKPRSWLSRRVPGIVNVTATGATGVNASPLFNGDVNDDDQISPADFSEVLAVFGSESGGPGYNLFADLNRDAEVGPADFTVVLANFGLEGEAP